MGGMARTAGTHSRLVKYINIIHPHVSGWAQGGAVRISVRRSVRKAVHPDSGPGFGRAPAHPLSEFFVEPDAE